MDRLKKLKPLLYLPLAAWPLLRYAHHPIHSADIFLSALLASALLSAIFFLSCRALRIVVQDFSPAQKVALFFLACFQLVQWLIVYPGLVSPDDIFILQGLYLGHASPWHSISYSLLISACELIFANSFQVSILNSLLFCFSSFLFLRLLPKSTSPFWLVVISLFFCMPHLCLLGVYENRDSINSLLLLWLFFGLLAQKTKVRDDIWFQWPCLTGLALLLGDIRQDGKIQVLLFPIALVLLQKRSFRFFLCYAGSIYAACTALSFIPAHYFYLNSYSNRYVSTAYINPLSYILHKKGLAEATPAEREKLDRFFHSDYLLRYYDPYDIAPLHIGGVKESANQADFEAFQSAAQAIILRNLPAFAENRISLAKRMLNFDGSAAPMADSLRFTNGLSAPTLRFIFPYRKLGNRSKLEEAYIRYIDYLFWDLPSSLRFLFSSCLIPLVCSLGFLFLWRRKPELCCVAFLSLVRLGIILLLAPASYFKYISSFWAIAWLMLMYYPLSARMGSGNLS